jgi:acyl-CoA thioester hydrolase
MNTSAPFRFGMRVHYAECDQQGVVFNPRYGEYVDNANTEFMRHVRAAAGASRDQFQFQVVRLLVEWKGPARFDDVLDIYVSTVSLGTTSFTLRYEIVRRGERAPLAIAESINVNVDPVTWKKAALSDIIRKALLEAANGMAVDQSGAPVTDIGG